MPRGCANEVAKARFIEGLTKDAADNYSKILTRYPVMERSDDAKKRLAALHQPIPRPTKAAVAQNRAEEASRRESTTVQRLMGIIKKGPDVAQAAKVGEPTVVDPEPVRPSMVFQKEMLGAANPPAKNSLGVEIVKPDQPGANDPTPRSDAPPPTDSPFGQPTGAATAQPPAPDPNELKPNAAPADPNELKPTDGSGDLAPPAPPQVNEIQQGGQPSPSASVGTDTSGPASDEEISSSKKKKKKGMKKVVPF
jgi:outer membrane protein assembly factor BamD